MSSIQTATEMLVMVILISIVTHPYNYNPRSLQEKRILISDATSTFGRQLAYDYAKLKTKLILAASNEEEVQLIASKCRSLGAISAHPVVGNIANKTFRHDLVSQAQRRLGGLDHLILNHWPWSPSFRHADGMNFSHFTSYVDLVSKAMPLLQDSKGYVGIITSFIGKMSVPGMASYSAEQAAIVSFFSSLRQEQTRRKSGVSVTTLSFGFLTPDDDDGSDALDIPSISVSGSSWTKITLSNAAYVVISSVEMRKPDITLPFVTQFQHLVSKLLPNTFTTLYPLLNY